MPLLPARCPDCGATVQVDTEKRAGICTFCKNPFVVEDAINQYNYHVTQNIQADTVTVYSGMVSMEELLQREPIYIRTKQDGQLEQLYNQMIQHYPQRYEGWWGLIQIRSRQFTECSASTLALCDNYWEQVKKSTPPSILVDLTKTYENYHNKAELFSLNEQERELQSQINNLESSMKSSSEYHQQQVKDYERANRQNNKNMIAAVSKLIIGLFIGLFVLSKVTNAANKSVSMLAVLLFLIAGLGILFTTLRSFFRTMKRNRSVNSSVCFIIEQQNTKQSNYESNLQKKKNQLAQIQQAKEALRQRMH